MKILQFLLNIVSWGVIGVIAVMALYVASSNFDIFAGYRSYLIQSGSMEPAIMTGDIVVTARQNTYLIRDVITFKDERGRVITHRIAEEAQKDGTPEFITKGDANRSQDFDTISVGQIIGKVVFVVPKLGYLVAFSKSLAGICILVFIPAALFIVDALLKIKNA